MRQCTRRPHAPASLVKMSPIGDTPAAPCPSCGGGPLSVLLLHVGGKGACPHSQCRSCAAVRRLVAVSSRRPAPRRGSWVEVGTGAARRLVRRPYRTLRRYPLDSRISLTPAGSALLASARAESSSEGQR